jgi:transitional endoplasmic reticulum ATPase
MYSGADIKAICDDAAEIPLQEALEGKEARKIALDEFSTVLSSKRSSIIPWQRLAGRITHPWHPGFISS